jgi:hypothetical protein
MDIQAIGASATVAFFCAIAFILAIKTWHALARVLSGQPSFADSIMSESAQRFRDELKSLSRRQSTYVGAALVFGIMFAAAALLEGPALFGGYPEWQLYLVFAALLAAAVFAAFRLTRTILRSRQARFLHDANLAIGHQLQRIAVGHGCTYHDVPTADGIIDHVLIGQNGIYAITVVARRRWRKGEVRLDVNELRFSTSGEPYSVIRATAGAQRLARECRHRAGRPVRVRSVIAVPGWEVSAQTGHEHLLVNERNLAMMRGWRDRGDYLMDEEADAIQQELTRRCSRRTERRTKVRTA